MTEAGVAISVLIPTHGRPTLLRRTLESLAVCRLPEGYREAVVVENGSRDGAEAVVAEVAAAHPGLRLRYMHVEWGNKSHALNEALKTVEDGLVVFFDDDVRLDPGVLEAYAGAAGGRTGGAFFGGPTEVDYEEAPPEWLLPLLPASVRGFSLEHAASAGYYLGSNWATFVRDLRSAGGFDSEYGPGSPSGATGQESDMQRRLRRADLEAVDVPSALVWHHVPAERCTPGWAVQRMYRSGTGKGAQARRGTGARLTRQGVKAIAIELPRYLLALIERRYVKATESKATLAFWLGYLKGYLVPGR